MIPQPQLSTCCCRRFPVHLRPGEGVAFREPLTAENQVLRPSIRQKLQMFGPLVGVLSLPQDVQTGLLSAWDEVVTLRQTTKGHAIISSQFAVS